MLDALRKGAGTWVAKIFIALLVMSFAVWGVADIFQGFGQNVAAKVGDTEISIYSFDRTYRRDLNNLGRQIGRPLSTTEGAQFGIPQQTLGTLVAEAALNETATGMKLGVSDQKLAALIQADPAFQSSGGGYNRNQLDQVLRNSGMSEDDYVRERRKLAERQLLAEGISGGMAAPSAYLEALHSYQAETRDLNYVLLDASLLEEIADPDTSVLSTYFEDEKEQFRAPEFREITLLELSPEKLARADDISDEDARAEYERDLERYSKPEQREVRQMSFPDPEEAALVAQKITDGASFDDILKERSLGENDVNLGTMSQTDFLDSTIADAAFALAEGETSGVVDGRFSSVILNVTKIEPQSTRPFEEVQTEIKAQLAREQAEREVLDLLDEIEDARAGGALLPEIAQRFHLTTTSPVAFDTTAKDMQGGDADLPEVQGLVRGAFDSDIGIENDPLQLGERGFLWYEVAKVIPSRDTELDEVRDRVIAAWKSSETERMLNELSSSLIDKAKTGTDLETVAREAGTELKFAAGVARNAASGDISAAAATAAFNGPQGSVFDVAAADDTSRLLIEVDAVNTPAFFAEAQEMQALRQQLSQQMQDSLLNQYVADIEAKVGVEINQSAIALVINPTEHNM